MCHLLALSCIGLPYSKVQKQGRSLLMLDYSVTDKNKIFITKQKRCMVARAKTKEKRTETREIFLMLVHSITDKNNEIFSNASYLYNE